MHRKFAMATVAACLLATLSACGGSDDGGEAVSREELTRIVIDYSPTANNAQLSLGIEQGIFERHGLEIEQVPGSGASANSVALLLNGQIQLAVSEITATPAAVEAGFPVQIVTSLSADYESPDGDAFSLVVPEDSDIRSFADLEGRNVAVNAVESFWDLTVLEAVRRAGGDPDRVRMLGVPFEDQGAAIRQGRVDAVTTLEPFAGQLLTDGYRSIGDPASAALGERSVAATLIGSTQYIDENPDVMRRFVEAWEEATEYASDHPDEIRQTIVETTGAPPEAVENLPLPWYVSGVDRRSAEAFSRLMVRYDRLESPVPVDDFVWAEAPDADLETPPSWIDVGE